MPSRDQTFNLVLFPAAFRPLRNGCGRRDPGFGAANSSTISTSSAPASLSSTATVGFSLFGAFCLVPTLNWGLGDAKALCRKSDRVDRSADFPSQLRQEFCALCFLAV
jgi:hypothetical protein